LIVASRPACVYSNAGARNRFSHEHSETAPEHAAIARTIWGQDNVAFKAAGIDNGSRGASQLILVKSRYYATSKEAAF
jgi:hypothetical protein